MSVIHYTIYHINCKKVVKKINGIALVMVFLKRGQMKCTPGGHKGENSIDPFIISHQNVFLQQS